MTQINMTKREFEKKIRDIVIADSMKKVTYKCPTPGCPMTILSNEATLAVVGKQPCSICREERRRIEQTKRKIERCS